MTALPRHLTNRHLWNRRLRQKRAAQRIYPGNPYLVVCEHYGYCGECYATCYSRN